jgi:hypothetical protein
MSKRIILAGVILMAGTGIAFADHGKAGLWSITISMGGSMPNMPDMSKLPPEVVARMKTMGMSMNGNSIITQHCMTAKEVADDMPRLDTRQAQSCKISNVVHSGGSMSADMSCSGAFDGTGHVAFTYDSDTHYSGNVKIDGVSNGHPMTQNEKMEGHWVSASCGNVRN